MLPEPIPISLKGMTPGSGPGDQGSNPWLGAKLYPVGPMETTAGYEPVDGSSILPRGAVTIAQW